MVPKNEIAMKRRMAIRSRLTLAHLYVVRLRNTVSYRGIIAQQSRRYESVAYIATRAIAVVSFTIVYSKAHVGRDKAKDRNAFAFKRLLCFGQLLAQIARGVIAP